VTRARAPRSFAPSALVVGALGSAGSSGIAGSFGPFAVNVTLIEVRPRARPRRAAAPPCAPGALQSALPGLCWSARCVVCACAAGCQEAPNIQHAAHKARLFPLTMLTRRGLPGAQAPRADVHATINLTERARGVVTPSQLTFSTANWAQPQVRGSRAHAICEGCGRRNAGPAPCGKAFEQRMGSSGLESLSAGWGCAPSQLCTQAARGCSLEERAPKGRRHPDARRAPRARRRWCWTWARSCGPRPPATPSTSTSRSPARTRTLPAAARASGCGAPAPWPPLRPARSAGRRKAACRKGPAGCGQGLVRVQQACPPVPGLLRPRLAMLRGRRRRAMRSGRSACNPGGDRSNAPGASAGGRASSTAERAWAAGRGPQGRPAGVPQGGARAAVLRRRQHVLHQRQLQRQLLRRLPGQRRRQGVLGSEYVG